ncbi:MAG: hypothetical protein COA44_02160 [Arcobacter sp.]|nr:MAG: hypothetical protein COA44_02160 [Arcobacter sp.]
MKKNNYQAAAELVQKGSFVIRCFAYLVFYVPVTFILAAVLDLRLPIGMNSDNLTVQVEFYGYFLAMTVPFIVWELLIRWARKRNGFSVNKNIEMEIEEKNHDGNSKK